MWDVLTQTPAVKMPKTALAVAIQINNNRGGDFPVLFMCHSERSEESLSKKTINSTEILRRDAPQNDILFTQSQRSSNTLTFAFA